MSFVTDGGGGPAVDPGLAAAASSALRQAASQIDQLVQQTDVPLAKKALANWKGPYADQFGGQKLPWIRSQACGLTSQMRAWAAKIDAAAAAARRAGNS